MKKIIASLSLLSLVFVADAALNVYEPFNYPTGSFTNNTPATGTGLTGKWTCGASETTVSGLSYTGLSVADNALSSGGSRQYVSFATPLSTGTKWISFLYRASGNMGGNIDGVFFPNGNSTCLWFGFGLGPYSGSAGQMGLGSMTTAGNSAQGASTLKTIGLGNYAQTYLVALRIDFNTSGNNDTVTIYTNPVPNMAAPGVAAAGTNTSFDVGTISGVGLNVQGGASILVDEIRVGDTYGDVVGYSSGPTTGTNQTSIAISPAIGKQVNWTAQSTNSYQVQKSADNINWINYGSLINGASPNSVYDTSFLPYYQVLEYTYGGAGSNVISNGSFEIAAASNCGAANWNSAANSTYDEIYVTNQYGSLLPEDGANLLFMDGSTAAVNPSAPTTSVASDLIPVAGGLPYAVSFYAANPVQVGGANPQYRVRYYDTNIALLFEHYASFASAGTNWAHFSSTNTAPANAAYTEVYFTQAVGAGASWNWVTLIDNVSVYATSTFGPTNTLTPTVKSGVIFTASIETNGAAATGVTGTVAFETNGIGLITNGIAGGIASSSAAIIVPPYTVTAIYSGDTTYAGSTNTLTVSNNLVAVTLGNLNQTYSGAPESATANTVPGGFTVALTYNGSSIPPTQAGTYLTIGTVLDNDYQGSATNNLIIGQAMATVTLGNLSQTYDGMAESATATTTPPGLTVAFTYNGSPNAPTNAGTYTVVGTIVDNNYYGAATNSLVIAPGATYTPTNITAVFSGNQLTISWPSGYLGWILQSQTNSLSTGFVSGAWTDVGGSGSSTQAVINVDTTQPCVFFRLRSP